MSKSQKSAGNLKSKSGEYAYSKKSEAKTAFEEPALALYDLKESRARSIKGLSAGIAFGNSHGDNYHHETTIMVEKTDTPEWQMTAVEKMDMVREGVSKKNLESLKSKTNLDYDKLSTILLTNRATLINKKGAEHFSVALSERIVSIADLYSYGFSVFEDEAKFNEWVFRPNKALGGKQPFELLDNYFGREEIKNVIGRIDYGVYS
jgi:putative toxin-antitoxin system antitoxin component (TIGR02293 family)